MVKIGLNHNSISRLGSDQIRYKFSKSNPIKKNETDLILRYDPDPWILENGLDCI